MEESSQLPCRISTEPWVVHKFGGSSLSNAERFRRAVKLWRGATAAGTSSFIVVSAMGDTTNELVRARQLAEAGDQGYTGVLDGLQRRAASVCSDLELDGSIVVEIDKEIAQLASLLGEVQRSATCAEPLADSISTSGEPWSARILHGLLERNQVDAVWLDSREIIVVEQGEVGPSVCWEETAKRLAQAVAKHAGKVFILTGYGARTPSGQPTTLRRNGSDFTASIVGRLLAAESVTIWTDVNGVLSADPRLVPEAKPLPRVSYSEAMELAYFGASVLHPQTMGPVADAGIPLLIRSSLSAEAKGTRIDSSVGAKAASAPETPVKALSSIEGIALLSLEGPAMIGAPGVASRFFTALRGARVSVILISQGSSEHSICAAVPLADGVRAQGVVADEFEVELERGQVQRVRLSEPYSIVAAVGDGMVESRGVAARFFTSLARAGVNVRAIAQGASERNISVVVSQEDAKRALRAVHAGFHLAAKSVAVGIVGAGQVGQALVEQILAQAETLRERNGVDLLVVAVANSRQMLLPTLGVDPETWRQDLKESGKQLGTDEFVQHVKSFQRSVSVVIDCTASDEVPEQYAKWLAMGLCIATPNKKAGSGSLERYRAIKATAGSASRRFLYEATVGAGLPVIATLKELLETGDEVLAIEGVLSGSLSYILGATAQGMALSHAVREAREKGYTEPHPRDDLSGMDVARKAVILARELGSSMGLDDVDIDSMAPAALDEIDDPEQFIEALVDYDAAFEARQSQAREAGRVLCYLARVTGGGEVSVGLQEVPMGSPFATLSQTVNAVVFTTKRYCEQPLVVQGPGAGTEVTAAGIFADLLRLASHDG